MVQASAFVRGFSDELHKVAQAAPGIPVQRIPSGPSPAPAEPPRPPLPTAPAYRPPTSPPASTPKRGGSATKPVSGAWLGMADRAPTESTGRFVNRRYGVPEFQMGINQGQHSYSGREDDPLSATVVTQPKRGGAHGIAFAGQPAVRAKPTASPQALQRVPSYLQQAVGGFVTPAPWLPHWGDLNDPNYLRGGVAGTPTISTAQRQPAQAMAR